MNSSAMIRRIAKTEAAIRGLGGAPLDDQELIDAMASGAMQLGHVERLYEAVNDDLRVRLIHLGLDERIRLAAGHEPDISVSVLPVRFAANILSCPGDEEPSSPFEPLGPLASYISKKDSKSRTHLIWMQWVRSMLMERALRGDGERSIRQLLDEAFETGQFPAEYHLKPSLRTYHLLSGIDRDPALVDLDLLPDPDAETRALLPDWYDFDEW